MTPDTWLRRAPLLAGGLALLYLAATISRRLDGGLELSIVAAHLWLAAFAGALLAAAVALRRRDAFNARLAGYAALVVTLVLLHSLAFPHGWFSLH